MTSTTSSEASSPAPLVVAMVAPSLSILGGQAVQARRLLDAWRKDREISAFLVPINPELPVLLRPLARVKYLRTLATQLVYLPSLVRQLRRADVVHVFSASYWSFLLAPLPAVIVARLLGRPVLVNYRSGEAPDHLRRSTIARNTLRAVDRNIVPSRFLQQVFAEHEIPAQIIPNIIDREKFRFRLREPLQPRLLSTRNFEPLYDVASTLRAFGIIQRRYPSATLTLVGAGSEDASLRRLAAELGLRGVHVCWSGGAGSHLDVLRRGGYLRPDADDRQHAIVDSRGVRERPAGGLDRGRRRPGDADRRGPRPSGTHRRRRPDSGAGRSAPRGSGPRPSPGPLRPRLDGRAESGSACATVGSRVYRELCTPSVLEPRTRPI